MDIAGLAAALRNLERGTTLPISAGQARSDLSADIAELISSYLAGNLLISGIGRADVRPTAVVYAGSAEFLGQTLPATATFWLNPGPTEGSPELTFTLALPAGWTFAATYPPLAETDVGQLAFTSPAWVLESAASDGSGRYAGGVRGLNFSGTLDARNSPSLAEVAWLFSARLHVTGALANWSDPQRTAPTMTLLTELGDTSTTIGSVTLATQLQASVSYVTGTGEPVLTAEVVLGGQVRIGTGPDAFTLLMTMPVVPEPPLLSLAVNANQALASLAALAGVAGGTAVGNLIPVQYPITRLLRLDDFVVVIAPQARELVSLSLGVTLLPSQPAPIEPFSTRLALGPPPGQALAVPDDDEPKPVTWVIIPPNLLAISDVQVRLLITNPLSPSLDNIAVRIGGTFWIANFYPITIEVLLPDVEISAFLIPGYTIPLADIIEHYGFDLPPGFELDITELSMVANPSYRTFDFILDLEGEVQLIKVSDDVQLTLTGISTELSLSQVGFACQFIGYANFAGIVDFALLARKEADAGAGWTFGGAITHEFSVGELIGKVTGWAGVPGFLNDMSVTVFAVTYQTARGEMSLDAGLRWLFKDANVQIDLLFSLASSAVTEAGGKTYRGSLAGRFKFLNMQLELGYAFDQAKHTNTYSLKFGELMVSYSNPDTQGKKVLLINFGNVTLGDIVSYLIKLADPAASSALSAPWSALNSISLSNLSIIVNFTDNFIQVDYAAKVNLGFISIDNVGLRYYRNYGSGRVEFLLAGEFLGQSYGKENPLAWNAIGGQPPAVPGAGNKLLDLRYAGIGQHVTLDATGLTTVKAVIEAMRKTVVPLNNTAKNPLDQVGGLRFDSGANWMFGASFTLLQTFAINAVFLDPVVYGLRIDVDGPRGDIFQGLAFEILYRKVTDSVGVYHIELKLPDAFRHLEFGSVSVTLPVVALDIYTNGNFRIDFGFPPSLQDWSRSFSVQVFPFLGYGGFYFAVLNGETSTRLPAIDNGRFDPSIEFGFALSVGVGKTISIGPLSAGVSVTVAGMVQGAIAWFNPADASTPKAVYYWLQGTVALTGHVYGIVDFFVIKATLDLMVFASITLTIECYQPILISMTAGVQVKLSLKILFITLHFSFSATISMSFTIGSPSTPPWHVTGNRARELGMRAQYGLHRPGPSLAGHALPYLALPLRTPEPRFDVTRLHRPAPTEAPAGQQAEPPITLWLTPVISQANPGDFLPDVYPAPGQDPVVAANFLLFIENAIDPAATDATEVARPVAGAAAQPYNRMMGKLLSWALRTLGDDEGIVTAGELDHLHAQLDDPDVFARWFSYASVTGFFADQQVVFEIAPRPAEAAGRPEERQLLPHVPRPVTGGGHQPGRLVLGHPPGRRGLRPRARGLLRAAHGGLRELGRARPGRDRRRAAPAQAARRRR